MILYRQFVDDDVKVHLVIVDYNQINLIEIKIDCCCRYDHLL